MPATMTIDLARLDALVRSLDFSSSRSKAAKALRDAANAEDAKINEQAFRTEGRSIGERWPKNKPAWASFKKVTTGQRRPLVFRGRLKESLTEPRSKDRIARLRDYSLTLGTRVPYAAKHRSAHTAPRFSETEAGRTFDSLGRWRIPARDFLARRQSQLDDLADKLTDEAIRNAVKAMRGARPRARSGLGSVAGDHRFIVLNGADVRSFLNQRTARRRGGLR